MTSWGECSQSIDQLGLLMFNIASLAQDESEHLVQPLNLQSEGGPTLHCYATEDPLVVLCGGGRCSTTVRNSVSSIGGLGPKGLSCACESTVHILGCGCCYFLYVYFWTSSVEHCSIQYLMTHDIWGFVQIKSLTGFCVWPSRARFRLIRARRWTWSPYPWALQARGFKLRSWSHEPSIRGLWCPQCFVYTNILE